METVNDRIDALGKKFSYLQSKMEMQKDYSEKDVSEVIVEVMREIDSLCSENAAPIKRSSVSVALAIDQAILEFYEATEKLEKYGEKYGEYLLN
jgi:hypothetical protein